MTTLSTFPLKIAAAAKPGQWRHAAVEIQGLRRDDLDHARQAIRVVGKGRKPRLLTLSGPMQQAWDALLAQLRDFPRADAFVFPQYPGWSAKALQKLGRAALGPDIRCNPHKFRHTWATQALSGWDDPWDIAAVAEWLGHKNVAVTYAVYKHLIPKTPKSGHCIQLPDITHNESLKEYSAIKT